MRSKLIIDGNAVYEIDEDCIRRKNREEARDIETELEEQTDEKKEKRMNKE